MAFCRLASLLGCDFAASVSRAGKLVAYAAFQETFNLERRAFDVETGGMLHADPRPLTAGTQAIQFAGFSPDGQSMAFDSDRGAGKHIW